MAEMWLFEDNIAFYDHRLTEIANDSFIAVANEVVIRKSAYLQVKKRR